MTLPEHLKIGYEVYRVSIGTKDFELQGECDTEHATIILTPNAGPRRRIATLIHEILHACWDQAEMGDIGDHDHEEQVVNRLASVLTAVLMDNPALLRCLDAAGQTANSTCWKVEEPIPFTAKQVEDAMHYGFSRLRERLKNGDTKPPDNERRSEQRRHCQATGYACMTPELCKSFNLCHQIGPV